MVKTKIVKTEKEVIPSLENQYKDIMENFDFHLVYTYMNWARSRRDYDDNGEVIAEHSWKIFINNEFKVPTIAELKACAESLLKNVISQYKKTDNFYSIHSGPFKASIHYGVLELECIIESWGNY